MHDERLTALLAKRYPIRARTWKLRSRRLEFGRRPMLMGIVNVTPDSFSDGGKYLDRRAAIDHGLQLIEDGADILDVGGESTRPYSQPVSAEEELHRVVAVVQALTEVGKVPVSIDTSKSVVARECIAAGAEIINDVTGMEGDREMVPVAVESKAGVCVMHMRGNPQTMQDNPAYDDVVREVFAYLASRLDHLTRTGVNLENVCLDPGIGFGKTHSHNLTLMAGCDHLHHLGCPLLVGHSNKGFLGKVLGDETAGRSAVNVGAAMALASRGVQVIRVHDVREVRQALLGFEAVGGIDGQPGNLD